MILRVDVYCVLYISSFDSLIESGLTCLAMCVLLFKVTNIFLRLLFLSLFARLIIEMLYLGSLFWFLSSFISDLEHVWVCIF